MEYLEDFLDTLEVKEVDAPSEPSTHKMVVTTQTEWHDVYAFCHEHLKLDDGEVAKITITKQ